MKRVPHVHHLSISSRRSVQGLFVVIPMPKYSTISARKLDIPTQNRHRNMKLYTDVIVRSQYRDSRLPQKAYAYSHAPVPSKVPYLSDITWSERLASYSSTEKRFREYLLQGMIISLSTERI